MRVGWDQAGMTPVTGPGRVVLLKKKLFLLVQYSTSQSFYTTRQKKKPLNYMMLSM